PTGMVGGSASRVAVRSAIGRNAGSSFPPPPVTRVTAGSATGGASSVAGTPTRYRFFRSRESNAENATCLRSGVQAGLAMPKKNELGGPPLPTISGPGVPSRCTTSTRSLFPWNRVNTTAALLDDQLGPPSWKASAHGSPAGGGAAGPVRAAEVGADEGTPVGGALPGAVGPPVPGAVGA